MSRAGTAVGNSFLILSMRMKINRIGTIFFFWLDYVLVSTKIQHALDILDSIIPRWDSAPQKEVQRPVCGRTVIAAWFLVPD